MSHRILVVDDDPNIRDLVTQVLESAGFSVVSVGDGSEALDYATKAQPELVLLDLSMPGMDGWQVHSQLHEALPDVPVVYMTAASRARQEAEAHHAAGYLMKPFELDSLLQTVARFTTPPSHSSAVPAPPPIDDEVAALLLPSSSTSSNWEAVADSLLRALWMRDVGTAAHSLRVANYALRLCHRLQIEGNDLRVIGLGALLHDIGKIGVRDAVLLKPGPLDDAEWNEIRAHSLYGRMLLEAIPGTEPISRLVYTHHERLDGRGYPEGLHAEELTREMRIISLVDAFDAMTSDRPYRRALSRSQAIDQLQRNAGPQFDPELVYIFIDLLRGRNQQQGGEGRAAPPAPPSAMQSRIRTVLCIEDAVSDLSLMRRVLSRRPEAKLLGVAQSELGLDLARQHRPDLIVLDLERLDSDGLDILRRLKTDPLTQHIPVVVLSAEAMAQQVEAALATGAYAHLPKPLPVRQFLALLDALW